jgi:TRAP-type C4-dicarboxylate transport system substrate-binding protein
MKSAHLSVAGALAVAASLTISAPAQAQQDLKFASVAPENSVWYAMAQNYGRLISEYSGGALQLTVYPGAQLGAQDATLSQALRGRIEVWSGGIVGLAGVAPEISPLLFPGVFESNAQANCMFPLLVEPTRAAVAHLGEFGGFVPVGWNNVASVNELASIADAAGQNMRSLPSPVAVQLWQNLGMTPVPLDTAETGSALSTGMVTLVDTAMAFWVATGHAELAPHYYLTQHNYNVGGVLIGNRVWEAMTDEQRAAIRRANDEAWNWASLMGVFSGFENRLAEIAGSQGATIHELSAEDRAIVRAAGEAVWETALEELGDGARAYLQTMLEIREQCPA